MKKFIFPFARVLDWRRSQERVEKATLERLYAALNEIQTRIVKTRQEKAAFERDLLGSGSLSGADLTALARYKSFVAAQCAAWEQDASAQQKRIGQQIGELTRRRRDVQLLERLEDRKRRAWNTEADRELQQQADEAHLARQHGTHARTPPR